MKLREQKLDCEFELPDGSKCSGLAHLFIHQYSDRIVFWYGVAELGDGWEKIPADKLSAIRFADGSTGGAMMTSGRIRSGYSEVGFVGTTKLDGGSSGG